MTKQQKIRLFLFAFFLVSTIAFAIKFPRLTVPFGFAYILYLMAKPMTVKMSKGTAKQRLLYIVLIVSVMTFSLFPLFATFYNVDTDFTELANKLPEVQKVLQDKFFAFKVQVFERFGVRINLDPVTYIVGKVETEGARLLSRFPDYVSAIFEWILLVPMFLYFFFFESKNVSKKFLESIPNPIFEKTYVLVSQFNTKFGEYIMAKFIEATILGTLITIGLFIIDFPYPFILGFIAGFTNILPYLGPIVGFAPALLVAVLSPDANASMLMMTMIYLIANLIDMILVFPLLVSKIVNLHPIIVVVSIIVGSQLGGVMGMIVIIPFIAFFKLLFKEIYKDLSVQL